MNEYKAYENETVTLLEKRVKEVLCVGIAYPSWDSIYELIGLQLLGVKNLNGGEQRKQAKKILLQFARFEDLGKKKPKLCVEIYDTPHYDESLDKDNRGHGGKYIDLMIPIMLDILQSKPQSWDIDKANLAKELGLVKQQYISPNADSPPVPDYVLRNFKSDIEKEIKSKVFSLLDSLQNHHKVITYKEIYNIVPRQGEPYFASPREKSLIEFAEGKVLEEMGHKNKWFVFRLNQQQLYYGKVYRYLESEYGVEWMRYYKRIGINTNMKNLEKCLSGISIDDDSLSLQRKKLAQQMATRLYDIAEKEVLKKREKEATYWEEKKNEALRSDSCVKGLVEAEALSEAEIVEDLRNHTPFNERPFVYGDDYLPSQRKLISFFVSELEDKQETDCINVGWLEKIN